MIILMLHTLCAQFCFEALIIHHVKVPLHI
jgi:hypothetical protein